MAMGSSQEERALTSVGEAAVKYTGIDDNVSNFVQQEIDKTLPKEYKDYAGYLTWLANTAVKGKVELKWNF